MKRSSVVFFCGLCAVAFAFGCMVNDPAGSGESSVIERPVLNPYAEKLQKIKRRLESGEILFEDDFARDEIGDAWFSEEGEWATCQSLGMNTTGVVGVNGDTYPDSFLWIRQNFSGDIAIEYEAECLSDPANDMTLIINGVAPNYPPPESAMYLFILGGWGNTRSGIERAPDYKWKLQTGLFRIEPRRTYRVLAGRIGSTFYLFVDGELIMAARDPKPLPADGNVGFHVYHSRVRYHYIRIRKP